MVELLSPQELKWLNDYHAQILSTLSPHLQGPDLEWLKEACAPLS